MAKKKPQNQAKKTLPGASPISGIPPPVHTRWKPGQSGNPGGRPKGKSPTAELRRIFAENDGQASIALARVIAGKALRGDHKFITTILDRLDGPIKQHLSAEIDTRHEEVTDAQLMAMLRAARENGADEHRNGGPA